MAVPRVLWAVPIILAGWFATGFTHDLPMPNRPGMVGMKQEDFDRETVRLRVGERLELYNDSNFLHVVAVGADARVTKAAGAPAFGPRGVVSVPRGTGYQTLSWDSPGTYHVTCTLHPEMNLTVIVSR